MDEAVGVAGPGGRSLRLRREAGDLDGDGSTDRIDLHHLEERKVERKVEHRQRRMRNYTEHLHSLHT